MKINRRIVLDAPVNQVWKTVGEDFTRVGDWSTSVPSSGELEGTTIEGAPAAGRTCSVAIPGFDSLKEVLIAYDATDHSFTYHIAEGLPDFVSEASNVWTLYVETPDRTRLQMEAVVQTQGFIGWVMQPMLKLNFIRTFRALERDLRHMVEKGEPSAAKGRQLAKAAHP